MGRGNIDGTLKNAKTSRLGRTTLKITGGKGTFTVTISNAQYNALVAQLTGQTNPNISDFNETVNNNKRNVSFDLVLED